MACGAAGVVSHWLLRLCDFEKCEEEQVDEYNVEVGERDASIIFEEDE